MDDIMAIARSTASRVLHIKSLYFLLAVGVGLMATGQLYGEISAGMSQEYSMELGLMLVGLTGILSALVACFDLPRELREKTMVTLLSKPLGRDRYLVGKFLGVCVITLVTMGIMGASLMVLTSQSGGYRPNLEITKGIILLFAGMVQFAAIGILMGTFLGEWLAAAVTLLIFWASYAMGGVILDASGFPGFLCYLLPNFRVMDVKPLIAINAVIDWTLVGNGVLLAVLYSTVMLIIAGLIFRRKDIA
ncbi:MAG: ABC transporter permease subunit [Phycisphaerae bacterium]|nr:ABC transporter permease subunit [Phycisphaerae bacterium]